MGSSGKCCPGCQLYNGNYENKYKLPGFNVVYTDDRNMAGRVDHGKKRKQKKKSSYFCREVARLPLVRIRYFYVYARVHRDCIKGIQPSIYLPADLRYPWYLLFYKRHDPADKLAEKYCNCMVAGSYSAFHLPGCAYAFDIRRHADSFSANSRPDFL